FVPNANGTLVFYVPPGVIESNASQSAIIGALGTLFCASCYFLILYQLLIARHNGNITDAHEKTLTLVVGFLIVSLCTMTAYFLTVAL
ncbi:hypothetical protein PMAYCL1PPCAC_25381, partial [Pristionchus mayeri]